MPKKNVIITLGILVALLPLLGFPRVWESFFQVLAGLLIVGVSVWAAIDKRLMLKAKAHKRHAHRMHSIELGQTPNESTLIQSEQM